MNRKKRKTRKMQLKKQGLEAYKPSFDAIITVANKDAFPSKLHKHFKGKEIQAGKLKDYEFIRKKNN